MSVFYLIGSKDHLAPLIVKYIPEHHCYVEPFGGTGAVLFHKPPSPVEVFNDINHYITNFMLQLRDNYNALVWKLTFTPFSRELYNRWVKELSNERNPLELAAKWFFVQMANFGHRNCRIKTGFRHSIVENVAEDFANHVDSLKDFAKRLRHVQIENRDAFEVIEDFDGEDVVIYADPPYLDIEEPDKYYGPGTFDFDHQKLAELLNSVKAKVILSYYENEKLEKLYPGWRKQVITVQSTIPCTTYQEHHLERKECLLFNFEPLPLFRWSGDVEA